MNSSKCSAHYTPVEWGHAAAVLVQSTVGFPVKNEDISDA